MFLFQLFQKTDLNTLMARLAAEQTAPMTAERFVSSTTHGVAYLRDTLHGITSEFGSLTATRAITSKGQLIWHVEDEDRGNIYLSRAAAPEEALTEASDTWERARKLRDAPAPLHRLIEDLRAGRIGFDVRVGDAEKTPLSRPGFDALLAQSLGFGRKTLAASAVLELAKTEPLVTHVLYRAWRRHQASQQIPRGFEAMC